MPTTITEPLRKAVLEAQRICPPSGVRLVDVFIAVCRGDDATAAVLRDIGLHFGDVPQRRQSGEPPRPPWPKEQWDEIVRVATGEAARRRHRAVGSAHIALVMLHEPAIAELTPDVVLARTKLNGLLAEISGVGGANHYLRPVPDETTR